MYKIIREQYINTVGGGDGGGGGGGSGGGVEPNDPLTLP